MDYINEALEFIKADNNYIYIIAILFVLFGILGYVQAAKSKKQENDDK